VNNIEVVVCKQVQMLGISLVTIFEVQFNLRTTTNVLHDMPSYINGVFGLGPFISLVVR
jgi:ABC-type phosphate transport system permease subunit